MADEYRSKELAAAASQFTKERDYWLKRLAGDLEISSFPYDYQHQDQQQQQQQLQQEYPNGHIRHSASERVTFRFPREIFLKLMKLSNDSELRLYIVLVAALTTLLGKYTGKEDIIIGAPIYKQEVSGQLINTVLAFRNRVNQDMTFRTLLMQVSQAIFEANEHQNYPIDTLLYKLNMPSCAGGVCPLFETAILLENIHYWKYLNPVNLNMIFSFTWKTDCIEGAVEYNALLYHKETVERVINHLTHLLRGVFASMDLPLSQIDIVTDEEKQQLLDDFNNTQAPYPKKKTLHELFFEQAERTPHHVALVGQISDSRFQIPGRTACGPDKEEPSGGNILMSYRELHERSDHLALLLKEKGVKPDIIVGIMVERSLEMIIGLLGILKAGGAYLPFDPESPKERINYMLADTRAKILVSHVSEVSKMCGTDASKLNDEVEILLLDKVMAGRQSYSFQNSQITYFDQHRLPPRPFASSSDHSNLAYVIFTSGTTGKPKAVIIEHGNAVNTVSWLARQYRIGGDTHVLQTTDYTFDPSVEQIFATLLHGAVLYLIDKELLGNRYSFRQFIETNQIHVINIVPLLLKELLGSGPLLKSLTAVISGGDKLEEEIKETIIHQGYPLYNHYGPTEITVDALTATCSPDERVTLGRPISNVRCFVLGNSNKPAPIGVVGELSVAGAGVTRGYLNNPELTWERFVNYKLQITNKGVGKLVSDNETNVTKPANKTLLQKNAGPGGKTPRFLDKRPPARRRQKFYKTGDLVRWLPNGHIEFFGRADNQVKIRGYRVELGEIESQLRSHPLVNDAVVNVIGDKNKYLSAYLILHSSAAAGSFSSADMREYLSGKLPAYMIPAYFIPIDHIPLTATGKVNRNALPLPDMSYSEEEYAAPRDEVEGKLAALWAEILETGDRAIGIDTNFFECGGHSLNATVLIARIHKELNVKVPMVELFKEPTIRGLSGYIKGTEAIKKKHFSIEAAETKEYYPLSSAQKRLYILQQVDETNIAYNLPVVMELAGAVGAVDKGKLEDVFWQLIQRHESLRTSFVMTAAGPVQKIDREVEFEIAYYNLPAANCQLPTISDFIRPFDLARSPLFRVGLIHIPGDAPEKPFAQDHLSQEGNSQVRHLLLVDMHHIVSDGTSTGLLVKEFMALYQGEQLPPLRLQYKDYAEWQNSERQKRAVKPQEEYWLNQFQGNIPVLKMPTDFPPSLDRSFAGRRFDFEIESELTRKIKLLLSESETTLYMVLLSAFTILLSKYSQQEDIVVGTGIAGRRHADLEHIMGMFVNMLAMRNLPQKDKIFIEFLQDLKKNTLDAFENQDFQFEELVKKLNLQRDAAKNPLFDFVFQLQNLDIPQVELPDLKLKPCEYDNKISRFHLSLFAEETHDTIKMMLVYSSELFKPSTVQSVAENYLEILRQIVTDKTIQLQDIAISNDLMDARAVGLRNNLDDFEY